jgi:hypothetical protein
MNGEATSDRREKTRFAACFVQPRTACSNGVLRERAEPLRPLVKNPRQARARRPVARTAADPTRGDFIGSRPV